MRPWSLLVMLAGCDLVFPPAELHDAPDSTCPLPVMPKCGPGDPDEDADGIPDDCDVCPQIRGGATEPDQDGDRIGDACDPKPAEAAACRSRRFFGMQTAAGWLDTTGWSFDGDAFTEDPDLSIDRLVVLRSIDAFGPGRLEGAIDDNVIQPGADATRSIAGFGAMLSDTNGYFCGYTQNKHAILSKLDASPDRVLVLGTVTFNATPGVTHRIQLAIGGDGTLRCAVFEGAQLLEELVFHDPSPLASGGVGVMKRSSRSEFTYLDYIPD